MTTGTHRRLAELDVEECMDLLERRYLGRIAFERDSAPEVLPVNYRFVEGAVVFRTAPGSLLETVHLRAVAFEVDDFDPEGHSGWSVLVRGKAEEVADPGELERMRDLPLQPWAPGDRDHYVRIMPRAITGRRIH